MATKYIKILSIDGGGIRGIIPAMVMANIERETGRRITDLFDYIAGTSTGGVLALGITLAGDDGRPRYTADDGIRLYREEGKYIFDQTVWQRIRSVDGLREERYPSSGVESVLQKYFGEARLKDSLKDVLITAYENERRIPWFFRSSRAKVNPEYDFPTWQVARSTSAAPTYFEPMKIDFNEGEDYYSLIDGAVFANNPTMCAFVDMKLAHPDADFLVVSLGTGQLTKPYPYTQTKDWGLVEWAMPVIDVLMHGVNETIDFQMRQLLPYVEGGIHRYYRFQVRLNDDNQKMDDISPKNLRELQLLTERMIHERSADFERLCRDLLVC